MLDSLRTIDQRSKSLKEFVHSFRSVNQIPEPVLNKIPVGEILSEVTHLFTPELNKHNIILHAENGHGSYNIYADKNLTMQVLINLMKNAIESMSNYKEGKDIRIEVGKEGSRYVNINISDTGCGIAAEDIDQIFVPFYSTKKRWFRNWIEYLSANHAKAERKHYGAIFAG
jgi:signal transduction histidine kinase